jgi:hypothetical protein
MKERISIAVAIFLTVIACAAVAQETASKVQWPALQKFLVSSKPGKPLERAGLSPAELKAVRAALTKVVNGDACQGARIAGCGALESQVLEKVQITPDGQSAVVLHGTSDCGTAGCPMWIVQIAGGGTVLLEDFGWGYVIIPSHEHDYFDVVTAEGNHEVSLTMWRFKGDRYQPFRCASIEATSDSESVGDEKVSEHPCPPSSH